MHYYLTNREGTVAYTDSKEEFEDLLYGDNNLEWLGLTSARKFDMKEVEATSETDEDHPLINALKVIIVLYKENGIKEGVLQRQDMGEIIDNTKLGLN